MIIVSRFSIKYDSLILLEHWLNHYQNEGFDTIHFIVDERESHLHQDKKRIMLEIMNERKCTINAFDSSNDFEKNHISYINEYRESFFPTDFVWVADADEFIINAKKYYDLLNSGQYDGVWGIVYDCFAPKGELVRIEKKHNIMTQFPLITNFSKVSLNANMKKIACVRGKTKYKNVFHSIQDESSKVLYEEPVKYYHLKWHSDLIKNIDLKLNDKYFDNAYYLKELDFLKNYLMKENFIDLSEVTYF